MIELVYKRKKKNKLKIIIKAEKAFYLIKNIPFGL